jgi:hypothetical protein
VSHHSGAWLLKPKRDEDLTTSRHHFQHTLAQKEAFQQPQALTRGFCAFMRIFRNASIQAAALLFRITACLNLTATLSRISLRLLAASAIASFDK